MKSDAKKLLIHLLLNSAILITLYFLVPSLFEFYYMPHIYLLAGAVLALYYVIYNRGFVGKNATPDMLPDTMSLADKQAFIEDSRNRLQRSKWVLTLLLPILFTFAIDMLYLFCLPVLESLFS